MKRSEYKRCHVCGVPVRAHERLCDRCLVFALCAVMVVVAFAMWTCIP